MAFACRFLIVVSLRFMPYELHNVSKCNLNSGLLSYIKYWYLGYLHNQILLTNQLIQSDDLSKICSSIVLSLSLTFLVINRMIVGNSSTLNQMEVGLIMVRAMKSIDKPSLPLSVYELTRMTHKASHGVLITILDGRFPYFCVRFFIHLASLARLCYGLDGVSHSFPVYRSFHCLFETGIPGVLERVVIPHDCTPLQGLWYYKPTFIAYATFVFNNLKF
jgi:hypothetical protein